MRHWILPEHIEDLLPREAAKLEVLRRRILDLFGVHGYELVIPPLLEHIESLLTGTGYDLDLRTFKLVDQLSGRMLGVRADITPQVARIDAHLLNRQGISRLCYTGSVLHTQPSGLGRTREPIQIGAEIYGHQGVESDIEIQTLMVRALESAGVGSLHLDLGHVAIFRALAQAARLEREREIELFQALQSKDVPQIRDLLADVEQTLKDAFLRLPALYGGASVLAIARQQLPALPEIHGALTQLEQLCVALSPVVPEVRVDLAELRGYHYHSGVVFAAYTAGYPNALALGGRYDQVGVAFGRARAATGFSMDLREIASVSPFVAERRALLAPYRPGDAALAALIQKTREGGQTVVTDLPGHEQHRDELAYDRQFVLRNGQWSIENR
ncbi:MAG: ATP phosphoribosyltransferase regulatory subunit [Burkholderiales bacterium]